MYNVEIASITLKTVQKKICKLTILKFVNYFLFPLSALKFKCQMQ